MDCTKIHALYKLTVGEVFEFASIKQLKEELEVDLQTIAIEEAQKKNK
jgi:hypothetical protein